MPVKTHPLNQGNCRTCRLMHVRTITSVALFVYFATLGVLYFADPGLGFGPALHTRLAAVDAALAAFAATWIPVRHDTRHRR